VRKESLPELLANSISHGAGALLSIFAIVFLLMRAEAPREQVGVLVFGLSMLLLYMASTLYHAFPKSMNRVSNVFKRIDHCAIYLLIAGTYTPFILILVQSFEGYLLLGFLWTAAITGIILKAVIIARFKVYHLIMYLLMGWSIIFIWPQVGPLIPRDAFLFLFLGGFSYTFGVVFYVMKKVPFTHLVWHFFVIAGSLFHFLSVYSIL